LILCGGAGSRLWPLSRPELPKAFLEVVDGAGTGLSAAVRRAGLVRGAGVPATISHTRHAAKIAAEEGIGTVLLEPESRGTAAAVAAGAAWLAGVASPETILVVLPSDHHVVDEAALAAVIARAADLARNGALVVLGARAEGPETAYGYILPSNLRDGVADLGAFVEKPSQSRAETLVAAGGLWNCGVFVGAASVILEELRRWAPAVASAAEAGVREARTTNAGFEIGPGFDKAPIAAFDTAVMEKTERGRVVTVDCGWSDLGAWDAVWRAGRKDADGVSRTGDSAVTDGRNVLARAAAGVSLRVIGVSGVAIVAEPGAVLVTGLDQTQAVRDVAPSARFGALPEAARGLADWFRTAALPLWSTAGFDEVRGDFREALTWHGRPHDPRRRLRVQARQALVFAQAQADGLPGPWLALARRSLSTFLEAARREDGLYKSALRVDGADLDPEARLYEHAFVLLALAGLTRAEPETDRWRAEALRIADALLGFAHAGGFREAGETPFQADPQMHLLEAALAWRSLDGDNVWQALADQVAGLALGHLIDLGSGAVRELFDADWRALSGESGLIEPGHQFEWAWLLHEWGGAGSEIVQRLFSVGERGVDARRQVVVDALWDDLGVRQGSARLWPQTERLRAALVLGETEAALSAANAIWRFLDLSIKGVWRERMDDSGAFVDAPSPASSLYHLHGAISALVRATGEAW
jgi:mannose-1-phosphate guanylyltransferase/mannose-6-phosphate isomerase